MRERDQFGKHDVDGRIIIQWIFKKRDEGHGQD